MNTEKIKAKPRRTPLVLWLVLARSGLAAMLVGESLFGPNPPVVDPWPWEIPAEQEER